MIDYVLTNKKYRSSVEDVCVRRGADIDSDHNLLMAKLRMHLKSGKIKKDKTGMGKIDKMKIRDVEIGEEVQKKKMIRKEFGQVVDGLENDWKSFKKDVMRKVTQLFCEDKKGEKKKWNFVSESTEKLLQQKRKTGNSSISV